MLFSYMMNYYFENYCLNYHKEKFRFQIVQAFQEQVFQEQPKTSYLILN